MINSTEKQKRDLQKRLHHIRSTCTQCGGCQTQCAFLQKYGLPGHIAETFDGAHAGHLAMAFECSLCGLCGAVCPEKLDLSELFLIARCMAVETKQIDLSKYGSIMRYEKRGTSPLFSYYGLPAGCDTVFFPGCTLPGTRPDTTWQLFEYMQQIVPNLGIVLDCCAKPSHDLGRQRYATAIFDEMNRFLESNGIRKVIVACPNCHKMFRQYGDGMALQTVYELIDEHGIPKGTTAEGELTVHDPCPMRMESDTHDAVRRILGRMGLSIREMKHRRKRTLCCGEGGSVGFVYPRLAKVWGKIRRRETGHQKMVTYCAGCAGYLGRIAPTVHIADLIFSPEQSMNGGPKVASSPMTYFNRLKLKHRFKSILKPAVQRVRPSLRDHRPKG